ncbi:protein of unknown function [Burkholderia multivorans]
MQPPTELLLEQNENETAPAAPDAPGDLNTDIRVGVASGRIMFHAMWLAADDTACADDARHSVVLVLDAPTMERYAALDDAAQACVDALVQGIVRRMLDRLPDQGDAHTLILELTDSMIDAACHAQ